MATSDEPPSAGLAGSLSRGAWASPQAFDVVRRPPAPPFWNNAPPPPAPPTSSNFLDLNAPFEEDPHLQHPHPNAQQPGAGGRVLPNFMDRLAPHGAEGAVSFLNGSAGKEIGSGGDGPQHSFIETNSSGSGAMNTAQQQQQHLPPGVGGPDGVGDEASSVVVGGVRDQEQQPPSGGGQDTGPFVDYLSQFSGGKKEGGDFQQERERSKLTPVLREPGDFPDELLSLSSSYHKKKGEQDAGRSGGATGAGVGRGAPPTDGAALFLASGRVQDGLNLQQQQQTNAVQQQQDSNRSNFREPRVRPMVVNFGSQMLDEKGVFRDVVGEREGQPQPGLGLGVEERSLFPPRNVGQMNRVDPFYSMPANAFREERPLLMPLPPQGSARETLDLSNNLSFKEEKVGRMAPNPPHTPQQAQAQAQAQNQHQNQAQHQQVRGMGMEPSKEVMSLSLKRPFEDGDASAEEYKRRRDEAVQQTSLYNSNNVGQQQQQGGHGGDGSMGMGMNMGMGMGIGMEMNMGMGMGMGMGGVDENSNAMEAAHMRRRERAAASGEEQQQHQQQQHQQQQRFQQSGEPKMMMMHASDQGLVTSSGDDKPIVWPPVVVIENTRLSWDDERSRWKGLGIEDIRKSLKEVENLEYARVKCLFDMYGQKSSAFVIFPPSCEGYFEAEALSDQLERSGKGKEQWMKVRPQDSNPRSLRGFSTPDLVSPDGQRILYGYLANPEDMKRADSQKNGLKWFSESFNEKVRKPAQQRLQDKEMQRVTFLKLEEEARQHLERLESDKNEVQDLMERVMERTKQLEVDKEREQVERQKYEQDLKSRVRKNEEEKKVRREEFHQREQVIRKRLEEYKQTLQEERARKALEAEAVRHGISETIKQHQARLAEERQVEALEEMKLEAELRAEMESKLFELEQKRQMEEKAMQDRQQEQLKELKRVNLNEKEDLLRQTIVQQEALMKEMEDAVRETQALRQKLHEENHENECVVCLEEFGDKPDRQRAHFKDCDHANVCIGCAMDLWKQKSRKCPYCNTTAKHKPAKLPAKIYF